MEIKKVALNDLHEKLGAKMIPFAGFNMPVRYSSDKEEHLTVRNAVGVFDVSHMGEFLVEGNGALELIQWISTNDASKLSEGQAQYSCMPNANGGIVDDLLIYRLKSDQYMLVVNASNIEKDWNWINSQNKWGATLKDISEETVLLAVQGPYAIKTLQKLTTIDLSEIKFYTFLEGEIAGKKMIISATGYTGAGGFELYIPRSGADHIWNEVFKAGDEFGIKPIGLGARDTLRLEKGYCLYGNDITDSTSPIEAGLSWVTKFSKSFVSRERFEREKEEGVKRKLIALELLEKGIPRQGYEILSSEDEVIGKVTSGTLSPSLNKGIGLGYVKKAFSVIDTEVKVIIRGKKIRSRIVKLPFVK
ncbi:MAG: glycine cleavage system aminomethyltransferase GcvT [Bacteroidota bacterium]